jgi:hypothetical protein
MKLISLARQHFERVIEDGCIYVDKTPLIWKMINDFSQVFLARPRRFGKSLLLSTVANLFQGNKALFAGLWIENNWNWEDTYPVIHFYMDKTFFKDYGLEKGLQQYLKKLAALHQVELPRESPGDMLEDLIIRVAEKAGKQVVLLFDEYDKPINDHLEQPEIAEQNREILSNFYGAIKPNSDRLRFLMLTGVSKFSHVSVFSKLNQLTDLSLNKDFVTMLGYTQEELSQYFEPYLQRAATELELSIEELLEQIKYWYNGYSWDGKRRVYNPVSFMRFCQERAFRNFWFTTGTPTFLVKQMKQRYFYQLDGLEVGQHVLETFTLENLELPALLLQTGYLTIEEELPYSSMRLGYPNHEVRMSMLYHLGGAFGKTDPGIVGPNVYKLRDAFFRNDIKTAVSIINTLFENIPYQLNRKPYEADFHALLYVVFRYMAMDARAEVSGARGRSDVVLYTPERIWLMEFKIDQSAEAALDYIKEQGYAEPLRHEGLPVFLLGINFNKEEQMVDDWKVEALGG